MLYIENKKENYLVHICEILKFVFYSAEMGKIFQLYKEKLEKESAHSVSVYSKDLSDFGISDLSHDSSFNEAAYNFEIEEERKVGRFYNKIDVTDLNKLDFIDNISIVEPKENRAGNFFNYVEKTLKTIKSFDRIDFIPQIKQKSIALPDNFDKRLTLIIDLDETLVHTDFNCNYEVFDKILEFSFEGEVFQIPLILRPGVRQFLHQAKQLFNIIIFTAGKREYADCILNYLDPENKIFNYRFYRDYCLSIKNKVFIKDLRIFENLKMNELLIIDNSLYSFANQLSNGILISSFYNDKNDCELLNLYHYLLKLHSANVEDIRIPNESVFNFEKIKNQIENEWEFF